MSIHNLRKALGLLIVDIVIIIGIFVLQFRTDSSIIEKIGNLQITLEKTDDSSIVNKSVPVDLNNKLQISFNGLNVFCDDQHPATIVSNNKNDNTEVPIKLLSYEKKSDLAYQFNFEKNINFIVEISTTNSDSSFSVTCNLPTDIKTVSIPFGYSSNMKISKSDDSSIVFESKKNAWELQALSVVDNKLLFSRTNPGVFYAYYVDDTKQFTFDSITELAIADSALYKSNINQIKNSLISAYNSNTLDSNITEQTVVSYIAAMAENGNYTKALDSIPQNFKHNSERTYLSAPYLNNLVEMNKILNKNLANNQSLISAAAVNGSLNILGIRNLANYLFIHPRANEVRTILTNAANINTDNCSLSQAVGIIQLYIGLRELNSDYAGILAPASELCVARISSMCDLNGNILTISENDTFLSVVQSVEVGTTLLRYGLHTENEILIKAGYAIVNSYITEASSFDLRTLSNIYPIIAYDNWYYPHFEILDVKNKNVMWAWTCAKDIKYTQSGEEGVFNIEFPQDLTHYVIIKGVPKFHTIYIYNMSFRTDARFETYNSSGYVYDKDSKTLLLKSRHKSRDEEIRIEIGEKPVEAPKSASSKPAATTAAEEKSKATENQTSDKNQAVSAE